MPTRSVRARSMSRMAIDDSGMNAFGKPVGGGRWFSVSLQELILPRLRQSTRSTESQWAILDVNERAF